MAAKKRSSGRGFIELAVAIVICILAQIFTPWWWIFAVITFLTGLIFSSASGWKSFFKGLLIVFISWMAIYLFNDIPNQGLLSNKMAALFSLPDNYVLFIVSSLVMGIIGGLTAVAGSSLRKK